MTCDGFMLAVMSAVCHNGAIDRNKHGVTNLPMRNAHLKIPILLLSLILVACGNAPEPTLEVVATETPRPTLVPTLQPSPLPTLQPSITPEPEVTPTEEPMVMDNLIQEDLPPPLTMDLPDGWQFGSGARVFNDIGELRVVPFALYTGPVTGGTGFIVILWDFPNATSGNPFMQEGTEPDLYVDGLRLLRLVLLEQECVIGTDLKMEYQVAGRTASGTQFSTSDCPELPDTRGWFAGLFEQNVPFVFYAYTEPITAMDGIAEAELQAILDSVEFTTLVTDE